MFEKSKKKSFYRNIKDSFKVNKIINKTVLKK